MSAYQDATYTRKLFDDVIALREPDRVPIIGNIFSWAIVWSKYTLSEALNDYDKLYQIYYDYAKKYRHDAVMDIGLRNPLRFYKALGIGEDYLINDQDGSINHVEKVCMAPEEYDELLANPRKFIYEKFFPRKVKSFQGTRAEAKEAIKKAMTEMVSSGEYAGRVSRDVARDFGVLMAAGISYRSAFDMLTVHLRGLKGTMGDIRRYPDKVAATVEALDEVITAALSAGRALPPPSLLTATDIVVSIVSAYMLNKQQFGKLAWPYIRRIIDMAISEGKTVFLNAEGNTEHLYDYFLEIPRGRVVILFESNDLRRAKKILGNNCAICGGIPADLLSMGTQAECIESAKRLLDDLAPGGGFVFSESKMLSYKVDALPENIEAVNNFVRSYGKY
jgi:hypothetical protein